MDVYLVAHSHLVYWVVAGFGLGCLSIAALIGLYAVVRCNLANPKD